MQDIMQIPDCLDLPGHNIMGQDCQHRYMENLPKANKDVLQFRQIMGLRLYCQYLPNHLVYPNMSL